MNIRKNIEALFLAATAMGLAVSYVTAAERPVVIAASAAPAFDASNVHTVVVKAARLAAR